MSDRGERPVRKPDDFLVFGSPLIGEEEKREVAECLDSGWIGTGPRVARFEKEFGEYLGTGNTVAVNSCTAALHLSMIAAELSPGDEVITTPLTFCSTVNSIIHAGATPVLADVAPGTMNIDPERIEAAITERTRAILPVHFAGRPCDMDALRGIAGRHGLTVIEDCAHAIETTWKGQHVGTFGDFGCFSFYVTKNLATGEGGMVVARSEKLAERIKRLALHGMTKDAWQRFGDDGYRHYHVVECGFKYNMMDIQAAMGIHQLERLPSSWEKRREVWDTYMEELEGLPLVLPAPPEPDTRHAYHMFTVLLHPESARITRDELLTALARENIGVGVHYQSIPTHPYYRSRFGWEPESYPVSDSIGRRTLSLPLSAKLTHRDVEDVVTALRKHLV